MFEHIVLTGFADEIDSSLDTQMQVLDKLHMNHIEMRGVDGKNLVDYSKDEAKEIKRRLDERGFLLSAVGSPLGKIGILDDFAPHMELFKHTVELAHIMDTPNIRMFSFYMPQGWDIAEYRGKVMEQLGSFADYAETNDVVLLHENEKGIYGEMADDCAEIMKHFYGEHFKAVFDFANFVQAGQNTMEAYELLKPYIAYIHVKDALYADGSVVPAGYGDGQVKEILTRLREDNYTGYLSLEPHLSDFTGFANLEKDGRIERKLSGEEAFTLAHASLVKLLEEIYK